MEQWRADLTIAPEFISQNPTFLAELNGQIIGFHALIEKDESWSLEHLWILPAKWAMASADVSLPMQLRMQPNVERSP
jgi:hypothetical protein